jgi:hypothetical protein
VGRTAAGEERDALHHRPNHRCGRLQVHPVQHDCLSPTDDAATRPRPRQYLRSPLPWRTSSRPQADVHRRQETSCLCQDWQHLIRLSLAQVVLTAPARGRSREQHFQMIKSAGVTRGQETHCASTRHLAPP